MSVLLFLVVQADPVLVVVGARPDDAHSQT